MNHFHGKFDSVISLRVKLVEEFEEQVPSTLTFNVGYFEGQSHSKISLVCNDDLDTMYARYNKKCDITLWCDSRVESSDEGRPLGKRRKEEAISKRHEKKEEVEEVYEELMETHHGDFSTPQLRLWARMLVSHLHDDRESPPNIPAFGVKLPIIGMHQLSAQLSAVGIRKFTNSIRIASWC